MHEWLGFKDLWVYMYIILLAKQILLLTWSAQAWRADKKYFFEDFV